MSEVTFRDFAGALGDNDHDQAARHLQALLGVDETRSTQATAHFVAQMKANPQFMMKAMGMRAVVENRDKPGLVSLLAECFALDDATASSAADNVLAGYPK